jgi:GTPase SAR1 family protein
VLPRVTHEVPTDTADGVNGVTLVQIMLFPSQGILLVFNSEKQETFNSLDDWLEEIEEQTPRDVVTFLVGTVSNLDSLDRVSREVAELYVKKHNACLKQYFECNPDDTKIVERIFHNLVTTYIQTSTRDTLPKGSGLAVRGRPHSRTPSPIQSNTSRTQARCSKC